MGWTYTKGATKKEIVAERVLPRQRTDGTLAICLGHSLRNSVLWTVWEITGPGRAAVRYIGCDLLGLDRGYGYGYKDMEECMHPYEYGCPRAFLDMVPEACPEWRIKVQEYWRQDKERREKIKALKPGEVVKLVKGCIPPEIKIVSVKPLIGSWGGMMYQIKFSLLA